MLVAFVGDLEAGRADRRSGVSAHVAAAAEFRPHAGAVEPLLQAAAASADRFGDVFEIPELAAGSQHARGLGERCRLVGDGAEHEREDDRVGLTVGQGQRIGRSAPDLDRHRRRPRGALGLAPQRRLRFDGDHARHLRRVMRERRARAGADLDDDAGQPPSEIGTPLAHRLRLKAPLRHRPEPREQRMLVGGLLLG